MVGSNRITMAHGAGGESMHLLLKEIILRHISPGGEEIGLKQLDDSAVVEDTVFTIDGHAVKPIIYPGGDIGMLAVSGTINDLSAMGAEPMALASSLIIEEGLETSLLEKIMESMASTARQAGVNIVTGDTKVVEKGSVEKLFATTAGIGRCGIPLENNRNVCKDGGREIRWLEDRNPAHGDVLMISGTIGDHGIALLSFREGYGFETTLESDTAPLNKLMAEAMLVGGITSAKDPTRGGVSNTLNEWADKCGSGIIIREEDLPFREEVLGASELLGIDPLSVGNEGKMVVAVMPEMAEAVLKAIKSNPRGKNAAVIGVVDKDIRGVVLETKVGGRRIVEPPVGDPIPRIC